MTIGRWGAAVLAALGLWAAMPAWAKDAVRGTASYREKITLPEGAVLEVRLEDFSKEDAPPIVLTTTSRKMSSDSMAYGLPYLPSRIEAGHRYRVTSRIIVVGEPWFAVDHPAPVFDDGRPAGGERDIDLALVRLPLPPIDKPDAPAGFALVGTYWKMVMLNGIEIPKAADAREMYVMLNAADANGQAQLVGYTGCNNLIGTYRVQGAALTIAPGVALTRMACAPGRTAIENGLMQALHDTVRWRAFRGALDLLDAQGTPLARFTAREVQ